MDKEMVQLINLLSGDVFKHKDSIYMKLMNPEIPKLARVSEYPVWAADIGNGHITKFVPYENVFHINNCYNLIADKIQRFIN